MIWILLGALVLIALIKLPALLLPKGATLSPEEAKRWMAEEKGLQLLDVRTKPEHMRARIAGSALIPVQELAGRLGELDPARPVLVYCASGGRSASALSQLLKAGFKAKHMAGGLGAWHSAGYTIVG